MNFGFNSNVRSRDKLYHVQTEDRGPSHPFLDTVVYEAGRVIYKRKISYEDFLQATSAEDLPRLLKERIAQQHQQPAALGRGQPVQVSLGKNRQFGEDHQPRQRQPA